MKMCGVEEGQEIGFRQDYKNAKRKLKSKKGWN